MAFFENILLIFTILSLIRSKYCLKRSETCAKGIVPYLKEISNALKEISRATSVKRSTHGCGTIVAQTWHDRFTAVVRQISLRELSISPGKEVAEQGQNLRGQGPFLRQQGQNLRAQAFLRVSSRLRRLTTKARTNVRTMLVASITGIGSEVNAAEQARVCRIGKWKRYIS